MIHTINEFLVISLFKSMMIFLVTGNKYFRLVCSFYGKFSIYDSSGTSRPESNVPINRIASCAAGTFVAHDLLIIGKIIFR